MTKKLYQKGDHERPTDVARASDDKLEPYRTAGRRDYARVVQSAAFRRLQGKTQLFPTHESDFFRNRLTHSIEVAQVARSIAIRINVTAPEFAQEKISTDIVETAALAHDLGLPLFGHIGEAALDEVILDRGGFEGNAQTLRNLAKLEKRQTFSDGDKAWGPPVIEEKDRRAGLNLSYRTLASVLKYDQEIPRDEKTAWLQKTDQRILLHGT